MSSECYAEVFDGEMTEACEFSSLDEANEILGLLMPHWNTTAGTLNKDEVRVPLLLEDENGVAQGKDPEIGPQPSASGLPLKIFFDMGRVELQVPSSPDAADPALLHPYVQGLGMAVEDGCGLICSEQVPDFEDTCLHEPQY